MFFVTNMSLLSSLFIEILGLTFSPFSKLEFHSEALENKVGRKCVPRGRFSKIYRAIFQKVYLSNCEMRIIISNNITSIPSDDLEFRYVGSKYFPSISNRYGIWRQNSHSCSGKNGWWLCSGLVKFYLKNYCSTRYELIIIKVCGNSNHIRDSKWRSFYLKIRIRIFWLCLTINKFLLLNTFSW